MTYYAKFSTLSNPTGVTYSADRSTANFDGDSVYNCWSSANLTAGKYVFAVQLNSQCYAGIVNTSTSLNESGYPTDGFIIGLNGNLDVFTSGSYNNVASGISLASGVWAMFVGNVTTGKHWVTVDGTNYYSTDGSIYSATQVEAGTGGPALTTITGLCPFVRLYYGAGSAVLNSGASSYPYTVPTGFATNLPPTLQYSGAVGGSDGAAINLPWAANDIVSGLNYVANGGSPTACTGGVTGASGTAVGPTLTNAYYTIALQSADATYDQTEALLVYGFAVPSGAGTLVFSNVGTYNLGDSTYQSSFGTTLAACYLVADQTPISPISDTYLETHFSIYTDDTYSTAAFSTSNEISSSDTATVIIGDVVSGTATYTTGSGSIDLSLLLSHIEGSGSITITGTILGVSASASVGIVDTGLPAAVFGAVNIASGTYNEFQSAVAIYAVPASETLGLNAPSFSGGTLSVSGTVSTGTLTSLGVSTDDGSTFGTATGLSVTGTNYTAQLVTSLSNGTYTVQAKDLTTSVLSNTEPLIVTDESITLTYTACTPGGTLSLAGFVLNGTPADLDISTNGGTSWAENTAYSLTGSLFTASGGTLSAGTYPIKVRDHGIPSVTSNTETLIISSESLTLTTATAVVGANIVVGGHSNNGPPEAIDLAIDGTWALATDFSSASGTANAAFSGAGAVIPSAGTYTVRARDHEYPYVLSNTLTETISATETITLDSATGTLGGILALAGVTSGAVPAGLNLSINGGTAYSPTSGYSSDGGTISSPWTASSAFTLSAGTLVIQVQDSVYPAIVSNVLTLTIGAPTEAINLQSATGTAGAFLALAGVTAYGPAEALNFSLDNGATWQDTTTYESSGNTLSAPWTAAGRPLSPGGYVVRVQDAENPSIISNAVTLVVAPASGGGSGGGSTGSGGSNPGGTQFGLSPNGRTIFLNPPSWDWVLDTNGNIAVANDPYATAQDVSSAIRLFLGELWYNTTAGVPYFNNILGQSPSVAYLSAQLEKAALSVPTVVSATAVITGLQDRTVTGQVQFSQSNGTTQTVPI